MKTWRAGLNWYGHILWMDEGNNGEADNEDGRKRCPGGKGRPRMRWMGNIRHVWDDINNCLDEGHVQDKRRISIRMIQKPDWHPGWRR